MSHRTEIAKADARRWRFGDVEFDQGSHCLLVRGHPVEVELKQLKVLEHLLEHAGEVVTKDALIRAAWPGRIISDAALNKSISRLRDAIADRQQSLIKTHHGYGYRLAVPVFVEGEKARADRVPVERESASSPPSYAHGKFEAEHRLLTVLFCDLVGSTQFVETLEPEAFREVIVRYRRAADAVCERYAGYIAEQRGDGLLIYFGYPAAHDDDAERAVRCGCELVATIARLDTPTPLSARVGIHTGSVVIGGTERDLLATGASLHVAARLQTLASPGAILIGDATFRLVPGLFVTRDFGLQEIRGLAAPMRVHQVLQPSGVRTRLEAATQLTPFVGREIEIGLIESCWRDARDGRGQAVLVSGEPGMGKSRLMIEVRRRLSRTAFTWLECRASERMTNSAYYPILDLMSRGLGLRDDDPPAHRLQRLRDGLSVNGEPALEQLALVAPLFELSLPPDAPSPPQLGLALRQQRTQEAMTGWILRSSQEQPLVIMFEDLHWADDSSVGCVRRLIEGLVGMPVLLLMTARPEFRPTWSQDTKACSAVPLDPLPPEDAEQMLSSLVDGKGLATSIAALILQRAGGVPLFVEELTRSLLESGQLIERDGVLDCGAPLQRLANPMSLQGLLAARLDRLGSARDLLQAASVLGGEMSARMLALLTKMEEAVLARELRALCDAGMLHVAHASDDDVYVFKHALILDAAYETLLKGRRQALHQRAAEMLETEFPDRARSEPERVAAHYEKAGLAASAVRGFLRAAEKAAAGCAYAESIRHAERARSLLTGMPDDVERRRLELEVLVVLGDAKIAALGRNHPDLDPILARTRELCRQVDDLALEARALGNQALMHLGSVDIPGLMEVGRRLLQLAGRNDDRAQEGAGYTLLALAEHYSGDFIGMERDSRRAIGFLDDAASRRAMAFVGHDGLTAALGFRPWALWILGRVDQAFRAYQEAEARAESTGHIRTMSLERCRQGWLFLLSRQPELAVDRTRAAAEFAERHGFEEFQTLALLLHGLARAMTGDFTEGLSLARHMLDVRRSRRVHHAESYACALIANCCVEAGRVSDAWPLLDEASAAVERIGERMFEAELWRVRGDACFADGREEEAERSFARALEIGRRQQARSWQLRTILSLVRLRQRQGRGREAHAVLKEIFDTFSEGFTTPDLLTAAELLADLPG